MMMPVAVSEVYNVTIQVDGSVYASEDKDHWNKTGNSYHDFWYIGDSELITIRGMGKVDG